MSQKEHSTSRMSSVWRVYTQHLLYRVTSAKRDVSYDKRSTTDNEDINRNLMNLNNNFRPTTTTADKFIARSMGNTDGDNESLQQKFRDRQRSSGDVMTEWFQARREAVLQADNVGYQENLAKNFPVTAKNFMKKKQEGNDKSSDGPLSLEEFRKRLNKKR